MDSYFSGSGTNAMAALLQSFALTDAQIKGVGLMPDWSWAGCLMDFCVAYYTTQLVRCAAFSFVLIGLVMLLRKILLSERTFLKGMLWAALLITPFLGKLFYENTAMRK